MSASLQKKKNSFHLRFRFNGKEFQRSLGSIDRRAAEAMLGGARATLHQLELGIRTVPQGVDLVDFVTSGGLRSEPRLARHEGVTIEDLVKKYVDSIKGQVAESYRDSQRIHLNHLKRWLGNGGRIDVAKVTHKSLRSFLDDRQKTRKGATVERERVTLRRFFHWSREQGFVERSPAMGLDPIKSDTDSPPFRTKSEIEAIVDQGGLSPKEIKDRWRWLYLCPNEIAELLQLVRTRSLDKRSFMLHAIAAYTGMRRNEILKLKWEDIDFASGFILARSLKQSRKKKETLRRIELHSELRSLLSDWRKLGGRSQHVVSCDLSNGPLRMDQANRLFRKPLRGTEWCLDGRRGWFKVGFHMYRHSFVSNLAAAGVDQRVIDEFVGHETEAMRRRYRHLFPNNRRAAIETLVLAPRPVAENRSA